MANWQGHETHPTGHMTSEVDWGGHDPNGSDNPPPMSIINLDDLLGRTFLLPMDENGERKRATISEHVKDQLRFKLKIDGDQMTSFHITNLRNTKRTRQTLVHWKMDFTDSSASKIIKDHILPQTWNTMEVATTYLLSGSLGSKHGNH